MIVNGCWRDEILDFWTEEKKLERETTEFSRDQLCRAIAPAFSTAHDSNI